jgi:hypothetical protein
VHPTYKNFIELKKSNQLAWYRRWLLGVLVLCGVLDSTAGCSHEAAPAAIGQQFMLFLVLQADAASLLSQLQLLISSTQPTHWPTWALHPGSITMLRDPLSSLLSGQK